MEKYAEALDVLQKGQQIDAERTDIYNLMGFCHFKRREHEEAIDCFKKVLKLDPTSAIDYANIASNYRDMGKTRKAIPNKGVGNANGGLALLLIGTVGESEPPATIIPLLIIDLKATLITSSG